jgi:hypothetical protein
LRERLGEGDLRNTVTGFSRFTLTPALSLKGEGARGALVPLSLEGEVR